MPALIDTFPYPWDQPEARELHVVLMQLYPSGKAAGFLAEDAGLNVGRINTDQAPYAVWREVLKLAASSQKTPKLIELARDENLDNPRRPFLDTLLARETPPLDSEPRGKDGAPSFVRGTDDISKPEALLFHDDLTLPIGRLPWLMGVLETLKTLAPAVCRLEVVKDPMTRFGTGFRIASDLLLSNWHVLTIGGETPVRVTAEFGYDDDGAGGGLASKGIACDVSSIKGEAANDWAVIKVTQPLDDTIPILALSNAATPALGDPAFIVQHPLGNRKRVAYVRNSVTLLDDRVLQYLSDTQGGSSGSPVLNDRGRLIGMHHAGGRPQEFPGKPPLAKNEGVRIEAVQKGLANMGIAVP